MEVSGVNAQNQDVEKAPLNTLGPFTATPDSGHDSRRKPHQRETQSSAI